jgi:hypothetical protein
MAGILDTYGYKESQTSLVTVEQQNEEKQNEIDKLQSAQIEANSVKNERQDGSIAVINSNDEIQDKRLGALEYQIQHITGGTETDFDFGNW